MGDDGEGKKPKKPKTKFPVFLNFIRQPLCTSFSIKGHPEKEPHDFLAVNPHLYSGDYITDRRLKFDALMDWILSRLKSSKIVYYPNFVLLGDLNLDFDNPDTDRDRIDQYLKSFDNAMGDEIRVYFPFLDEHSVLKETLRTNARLSETYDQIGLFSTDKRLPSADDKASMGSEQRGPDYGVFDFVSLFAKALKQKSFYRLTKAEKKDLLSKFEHSISDHMPLWMWMRLPLP